MLEISRMLVLSTAHVRKETAELLERQADENTNLELPIVYCKSEYGYFIHVDDMYLIEDEDGVWVCSYAEVPDDLHACILLAIENCCQWLCLDRDAAEVGDLPIYKWEEMSEK